MGTFVKAMLGVVVGGVLLIAGCLAVLSIEFDGASDEAQESFDEMSITVAEYESVETGETTLQEIEERFGEPSGSTESLTEAEGDLVRCLTYDGEGDLRSFRFCSDGDDVVESKSSS